MGVFQHTRPLDSDERAIVARELESQSAGRRLVGLLALVVSAAAVVVTLANITELGVTNFVLLLTAVVLFGLVGIGVLFGRRGQRVPSSLDFQATRLVAVCQSVQTGNKHQHRQYYVGSYRVSLRQGWLQFWPEGRSVEVELCFPPTHIGSTWVDAAIVSLPGINVGQMRRIPPPKTLGAWGLLFGFMFMGSVFAFVWVGDSGYWSELTGRLRHEGKQVQVAGVRELLESPHKWGAQVILSSAQLVNPPQGYWHLCELSPDALAALTRGDKAPPEADTQISSAKIAALMGEHCDPELLAARMEEFSSRNGPISDTARSMIRRSAQERCAEVAQEKAKHEQWLVDEEERSRLFQFEVFQNPANACVETEPPPDAASRFGMGTVREVRDESGVLRMLAGMSRHWYPGAPSVSLWPGLAVVLSVGLTLGLAVYLYRAGTGYSVALEAWKEAILEDSNHRVQQHRTRND